MSLAVHLKNLRSAPWLNRETLDLCERLLKAYFEPEPAVLPTREELAAFTCDTLTPHVRVEVYPHFTDSD